MAIDNFGRQVPNLNPSDLLGNTKTSQTSSSKDDKELAKLLASMSAKFENNVKQTKAMFDSIINYMKKQDKDKSESKKSRSFQEQMYKFNQSSFQSQGGTSGGRNLKKLVEHGLKKGSIFVADAVSHRLLGSILNQLRAPAGTKGADAKPMSSKKYAKAYARYGGFDGIDSATGTLKPKPKPKADEEKSPFMEKLAEGELVSKNLLTAFKTVENSFFSMGEKSKSLLETAWGGGIKGAQEFSVDIKQAVYQTQGLSATTGEMLDKYIGFAGKEYLTNVDTLTAQKEYSKNLKAGVRDQKKLTDLTVAQLNTEKQLGLEAGELNETFRDFALVSKFSTVQVASIGRGMLEAARASGMTGQALKSALSTSKSITEEMQKSSQLTTKAAANIVGLSASFQKFGVAEQGKELSKYLGSSVNLLLNGTDETATLLYKAAGSMGKIQDLQSGVLLKTPEGINNLSKGLDNVLKEFGVESQEKIDKLSDMDLARINTTMKSMYGMQINEISRLRDAAAEAGKSLATKLTDINSKMQKNITNDARKKLEAEQSSLKSSAVLGFLGELHKVAPDARNMEGALAGLGKKADTFVQDLEAVKGGGFADEADKIRFALTTGVQEVNKGLKAAGKAEMQIDSTSIEKSISDPKLFQDLVETINKGQQELLVNQSAANDPSILAMMKITQTGGLVAKNLGILNETLKKYLGETGYGIFAFLSVGLEALIGTIGSLISVFGGLLGMLAFFGIKITGISGIFGWFGSMFVGLGARIAGAFSWVGSFFGAGGGFLKMFSGLGARIAGAFSSIGSFFGAGGGFLKMFSGLGNFSKTIGGFLLKGFSKILGPLAGLWGAVTGFFEGGVMGSIFGFLTGGAKTGSFLSDVFGIQKGSALDKFLSIFGAMLHGGGVGAGIGAMFGGVGAIPGAILGALAGGIAEAFKMIPWESIWEGISGIGTYLWDSLTGAFGSVGTAIYDSVTGAFSSLGTWINDNVLKPLFALLPDWLTGGGSKVAEGVGDIAKGNVISGGGKVVAGGAEIVDAGIATGLAETAKAVGLTSASEGIYAAQKESGGMLAAPGRGLGDLAVEAGAAHVYKAAADYLPWSWLGYAEGTKQVKNQGLAMLHQGEIVVPKEEADIMKAIGSGPYIPPNKNVPNMSKSSFGFDPSIMSKVFSDIGGLTADTMSQGVTKLISQFDMSAIPSAIHSVILDSATQMGMVPTSPQNQLIATNPADTMFQGITKLISQFDVAAIPSAIHSAVIQSATQMGMVPTSPQNQLIATNSTLRAKMANVPSDAAAISDVKEENSEGMLQELKEIVRLLKNPAITTSSSNTAAFTYKSVNDAIHGDIGGGDYAKSDAINSNR